MATLPASIRDMSTDEKCELLDALWIDIASHPDALTQAQIHAFDQRMAEYENDHSLGVPWEQVDKRRPTT